MKNQGLHTLTPPAHAHVYILEKSQHKVPEEALKVSNTSNMVNKCLPLSASVSSHARLLPALPFITAYHCLNMAADLVFLGLKSHKLWLECEFNLLISLTFSHIVFSPLCSTRSTQVSCSLVWKPWRPGQRRSYSSRVQRRPGGLFLMLNCRTGLREKPTLSQVINWLDTLWRETIAGRLHVWWNRNRPDVPLVQEEREKKEVNLRSTWLKLQVTQ